jgi:hypothetical protein
LPKLPPPTQVRELRENHPPETVVLPSGTELWRVHFRGGDHSSEWNEFRRFGPLSTARFDHHTRPRREQDRAILYTATHGETCLAEAFQEERLIDRWRKAPWLAGFTLRSDVELLDLTGLWPTRAGASTAISSSESRWRTQHWSRNIYSAYRGVAGVFYGSSMHGYDPAIALYERAQDALDESPFFHAPLVHPALGLPLQHAANSLSYDLV